MATLNFQPDYSLVTAILPKDSANDILKKVIPGNIHTDIIINARGTLYRDKWYQKFTPSVSPEQTVLEMLVPENYAASLMDNISIAGNLHDSGNGAVYSVKCEKALFLKNMDFGFPVEKMSNETVQYKNNLTGIFCIIQKNMAEGVATAAIRAGSAGPTVVFGQGCGVRDKIGILRIAISPEKELIRVVVDHYDTEPVFEAMVKEGKLDTPGMGFIYVMPVEKGIVNIAGVAAGINKLASSHQIIKAIDELKGGSTWRTQGDGGNKKQRKFLSDLTRLSCVVERGKGDTLVQAAMGAGAPGASITYGIEGGGAMQKEGSAIAVNREMEIIELTLAPDTLENVVSVMLDAAEKENNSDIYFYTQPVPKALTYLG